MVYGWTALASLTIMANVHQANMTISGESAGAVYCHAHLVSGHSLARQCILQSGSLWLSPPQPRHVAESLIQKMTDAVAALGGKDLRSAPVSTLLKAVQDVMGQASFVLQQEDCLAQWESRPGTFERIMMGDTQYEVRTPWDQASSHHPKMTGRLTATLAPVDFMAQRHRGLLDTDSNGCL